jgi:subtilisin family serine protease
LHPRRWAVLLASLALLVPAGPLPATAAPPGTPPASTGSAYQLTLVTGDRVRVTTRTGAPDQVEFVPHRGSRSDSAVTTYSGGHTFVVPSAARSAVASGRLDRSLFDVTTLIAQRYDDKRSGVLPVIVEYAGSPATARTRSRGAALAGTTRNRPLASIGARAATVRKSSASAFWDAVAPEQRVATTIERISLDDRVEVALDQSVPQIGAPSAWQRGLTGKGVKIAVLDTGVDASHPDLTGRVTSANFSDAPDAGDHDGHGTHVASIAAGTGAASEGRYKGVAPEATILSGKVLDDTGSGHESGIIAGMEWAAAQGAAVANLSLGTFDPGDGTDPLSQALNRLSKDTGTLYVVAAGNCYAPEPRTVTSPGAADEALTVGSTDRDGGLSDFSCRGPRRGDGALKPELSAPGRDIVAARASGTPADQPVGEHYAAHSGTSMATPHVTGTAALLAQAQPGWKADRLKARLVSSADPQTGSGVSEQGAGRVDADQATDGSLAVDVAELELGTLRWPFPADDAVARTLTYTNPSDSPVTLDLTTQMDQDVTAPRLSTTEFVVPAGGQASVTVTTNRGAGGAGMYSGRVVATPAGADPLVTTVGWYAEPESYDLTVKGINRDGSPATADLAIGRPDGGSTGDLGPGVPMRDGTAAVRLPAGTYDIATLFQQAATDDRQEQWTTLGSGDVQLTQDRTVVLDARRGNPVDVSVRDTGEVNFRERTMTILRMDGQGTVQNGTGVSITGVPRQFFAVPTDKPALGSAEFSTGARLEQWPFRAAVKGGPGIPVADFYFGPRFTGTMNLAVADAGTAKPEELAGVRGKLALIQATETTSVGAQAYAAQQAGAKAVLFHEPAIAGPNGVSSFWYYDGEVLDVTIPAMRTSRVAAADLLARVRSGTATVKVTGAAATAFTYDLMVPRDRVPADPGVRLTRSDFAVFDESFGTPGAAVPVSESRHGLSPAGADFGGWLAPPIPAPYRRTSYVQANQTTWSSTVVLDNGGANHGFWSPGRVYRPGRADAMRWFTPVTGPTVPAADVIYGQGVRRIDGGLGVSFFPFGHGPDVFDDPFTAEGEADIVVERDGDVLGEAPSAGVWLDVPAEPGAYRITLDTRRNTLVWQYSTASHAVWEFRSSGAEDELMPVMLADLDVPQADLRNQVRTGRPVTITLGLRHQTGSTASRITSATLELSYDGSHWTKLPLRSTGDRSYVATVTHPAAQAGKAPTLRVTAGDAAGGKLTQEVTRAYGLTR